MNNCSVLTVFLEDVLLFFEGCFFNRLNIWFLFKSRCFSFLVFLVILLHYLFYGFSISIFAVVGFMLPLLCVLLLPLHPPFYCCCISPLMFFFSLLFVDFLLFFLNFPLIRWLFYGLLCCCQSPNNPFVGDFWPFWCCSVALCTASILMVFFL